MCWNDAIEQRLCVRATSGNFVSLQKSKAWSTKDHQLLAVQASNHDMPHIHTSQHTSYSTVSLAHALEAEWRHKYTACSARQIHLMLTRHVCFSFTESGVNLAEKSFVSIRFFKLLS
jgi:hypothetical protein